MSKYSTLSAAQAAAEDWPFIVVGAGLCGIAAAAGLADRGQRVLLVERASAGRPKTCGGCLNSRAVASLNRLGFGPVLAGMEPPALGAAEFRIATRRARFALRTAEGSPALGITRERLDAELIQEAIRRGVEFLDQHSVTHTRIRGPRREVSLRGPDDEPFAIQAGLVIAADGLASRLASAEGLAVKRDGAGGGKIGVSWVLPGEAIALPDRETITMCAGPAGYAGIAPAEDGRWNVAAALKPAAVREAAGPGAVVAELLQRAGITPPPEIADDAKAGVSCPPFPRRVRAVVAERLLLAGDAAGYVEPVTGEGMAWALAGAEALVPVVARGWSNQTAAEWTQAWRRAVGRRRRIVRGASYLMNRPGALSAGLAMLSFFPAAGAHVAGRLNSISPVARS